MPLRHSPKLTPCALAARRANALKSTGPRTELGKARSCLNALRHGFRAGPDLRARVARSRDWESLFMLDWYHECFLRQWEPQNERGWRYTVRLAAQVWCFMTGRSLRTRPKRVKHELRTKLQCGVTSSTYTKASWPRVFEISNGKIGGIRFVNPRPSPWKRLRLGWLPRVQYLPADPPKVKRVRRVPDEQGFGAMLGLPREGLSIHTPRLFTSALAARIEPWLALEMAQKEVLAELEYYGKSMVCNDSGAAAAPASRESVAEPGPRLSAGTPASDQPEAGPPEGQPCWRPDCDHDRSEGGTTRILGMASASPRKLTPSKSTTIVGQSADTRVGTALVP